MILKYVGLEGNLHSVHLAGKSSFTIGRAAEASLCIPDAKVSRIHVEIRFWDNDFVIKDLKSRNGTWINDSRIDVAVLQAGDRVRIGPIDFQVEAEKESSKGTGTILREVAQEMEQGKKGYKTVLREIIRSTGTPSSR